MVTVDDRSNVLADKNFIGGNGTTIISPVLFDDREEVDYVGGKHTFKYHFLTDVADLNSAGYYFTNSREYIELPSGQNPALTDNQSLTFNNILNPTSHYSVSFSDVANVQFSLSEFTSDANIMIGSTTNGSGVSAGLAGYELDSSDTVTGSLKHGDIWINQEHRLNWVPADEGTPQYFFILHELAHSLGLKHIVESVPAYSELDSQKYSITSYINIPGMEVLDDITLLPTNSSVMPKTLQLLDIAALQLIYGTNTTTRVENDTQYSKEFAFSSSHPNGAFVYTVFDAGGYRDTIDARGFDDTINEGGNFDGNFGVEINLNQGAFSSIGKAADSEFSGIRGKGNAIDNVAIAYGTEIENAYGTVGDDTLIGNSGNNKLYGGAGTDTFISSTGIDSIYGEDGVDTLTYKDEGEYVVAVYAAGDRGTVYKANGINNAQQRDNFFTMEHIEGSAYDDKFSLKGTTAPEKVFGLAGDDYFFLKADVTQSVYLDGGLGQDSVYIEGLDSTDFTQTVGATTIYTNIADPQLTLEFKDIEDVRFGGTDIAYAGSWAATSSSLLLGKVNYANPISRDVNSEMSDQGNFSVSSSKALDFTSATIDASLSTASISWEYEKNDPQGNVVTQTIGAAGTIVDRLTIQAPTQGGTGYTEFSFSFTLEASSSHLGSAVSHYFDIVNTVETGAAGNLQVESFGQWVDLPTFKTFQTAMNGIGGYTYTGGTSATVDYRFLGDEITFDFFMGAHVSTGHAPRYSGDTYSGYGVLETEISLATGSTMTSQSGLFGTQSLANAIQEWHGTDSDDSFIGSGLDENLYGLIGDDDIEGKDGIDRLYGGDGNDTLKGDNGADFLYGENDNDILNGGDGNDYLYGHLGNDTLDGGLGVDTLYGNEGLDILNGNEGADKLLGGSEDDTLNGGDGNDKLYGEGGSDTLNGDAGTDTLYGGDDNDTLIGGTGTDFLYGQGGADTFKLDLASIDRLSDFDASEGDTINIADLLIGYDSATDDINDFVTLVYRNAGRTDVRVNDDGLGNDLPYVGIVFSDLTGETVNTLVASGTLIVE